MLEDNIFSFNNEDVHFCTDGTAIDAQDSCKSFWEIGHHYRLKSETHDGFTITHPEYECKGIITEHAGIVISSVVMKNVSGIESMAYTLSKNDCAAFNIDYEPHLVVFPQSLPWEKLPRFPIREFNPNDFSTFPVSQNDGKIHSCAIAIENISPLKGYSNMVYLERLDSVVDIANYNKAFSIVSKVTIKTSYGTMCYENQLVPKNIISLKHSPKYIRFVFHFLGGVERDEFEHMSCSDMFSINIDASYLTPIKEYYRRVESYEKIRNTKKMWESLCLSNTPTISLNSNHIPIVY